MNKRYLFFYIIFLLSLVPSLGFCEEPKGKKENVRWTLEEWLQQRDRNRMMDLWLSFNSPSPYELMLNLNYKSFRDTLVATSTTTESSHDWTSYSASFSAFAQIFGLSLEYENNWAEHYNDTTGIFHFRIFGNCLQCSFINLDYGLRTRYEGNLADGTTLSSPLRLSQHFGEIHLQLYLRKYFGMDASYRQYLPFDETSTLGQINESKTEGGIFIDFDHLRVFGNLFSEKQSSSNVTPAVPAGTTEPTNTTRAGLRAGLKIFF